MTLATIRDIAIIALAVESFFIGLGLLLLAWQLFGLVRLLREELQPMLESAQETMSTVKGTTSFLSDTVIIPFIKAASYGVALSRLLRFLVRRRR
ncbi:MAG: hypothetical protein HYZ68_05475 [Chloroflexi bacterium]|nr:hypothetical protein [Chloroflexota bacterium]